MGDAGSRGLNQGTSDNGSATGPEAPPSAPQEVARLLTGDMPCIVCGYNLKSLSVRHVCPECGTPVRVTVLAVVDPYASVLQPIYFPRATAAGIVVWSCAALGAALMTWGQRIIDVCAVLTQEPLDSRALVWAATFLIALSGVGAASLIRPHARIPIWQSAAAFAAVLLCFGEAFVYWKLHGRYDRVHTRPFVESPSGTELRGWLRLAGGAIVAVAVVGLRPNARMLAARSLVLRLGRADRQTMLAMAASLGVAALGDAARLTGQTGDGPIHSVLDTLGIVLIAVGSMLFTVGLTGVVVDCLRIAAVIIRPARGLDELVSGEKP